MTEGHAAAAPALTRALEMVLDPGAGPGAPSPWLWLAGARPSIMVALELWDAESWHFLGTRQAQVARDTGALVQLRFALHSIAGSHILAGEFSSATLMLEEDRLVAEATGNRPVAYTDMMLAAWRGQEAHASELIESTAREAAASGQGRFVAFASYASSVLHNGLGRHDVARDAAARAFEGDQVGRDPLVLPELAEAASRTGDVQHLRSALETVTEHARVTRSEWALGVEARIRALLGEGDAADHLYRESIAHLGRTRLRVQVARGHLLYGEWLRRERRRVDAREQLRTAHEMLAAIGAGAFAERARRELLATGGTVRKRTIETRDELTAQEALIAGLARDGLSNPEIGTRLFISPRTVKYHLRKVFIKLDISSRNELDRALARDAPAGAPL
jgi:ATP/maltotriose-dependent transcriptional regulator MalT